MHSKNDGNGTAECHVQATGAGMPIGSCGMVALRLAMAPGAGLPVKTLDTGKQVCPCHPKRDAPGE